MSRNKRLLMFPGPIQSASLRLNQIVIYAKWLHLFRARDIEEVGLTLSGKNLMKNCGVFALIVFFICMSWGWVKKVTD